MQARPYILLSGTRLAHIERMLAAALHGWQAQWGDAGLRIECQAAGQAAAGMAPRAAWSGNGLVWLAWHDEFGAAIERALFGGVASGLAHTLAARALQALLADLAGAALPGGLRQPAGSAEVAPAAWLAGSGALLVSVHCGRHALQLLLDRQAVAALAPAAPLRPAALAPCRLQQLAGTAGVALPVRLGTVQLDLASLMSVQVGDVIRLDAAADQPLPVLAPDGSKPLFYGHLGRAGRQLALEVGK